MGMMNLRDRELLFMLRNNVGVSDAATKAALKAADRIEELSDKLAKAVAELEDHLHCHDCTCGPCEQIRETLAELGEGT